MPERSLAEELLDVERTGWEALCTTKGAAYYRDHLTEDARMAFPFGTMDRAEALAAMERAEPWARYEISDAHVVVLGPDSGVLVYRVTAQRPGDEPFSAVVSSTFVRRGGHWKLAFHQQSF